MGRRPRLEVSNGVVVAVEVAGDPCVTGASPPAAGASPVGLSLPPEPGTKGGGKAERSLQRCASASSAKLSSSGECPHHLTRVDTATSPGQSQGPRLWGPQEPGGPWWPW